MFNDDYHDSTLHYEKEKGYRSPRELSVRESLDIHREENRVYFSKEIGFYTVYWEETGNNDLPHIIPIRVTN